MTDQKGSTFANRVVTLSPSEIMQGAMIGVMRQVQNLKTGHGVNYYGAKDHNSWTLHVEGALGEMALAKYRGVYYAGMGRRGGMDVDDVDVRTTTYPNGCLIVHDADPDDRVIWLLTGVHGSYTVRGWILSSAAKRKEWIKDPQGGRAAYFVPQEALNV